MSAEKLWLVEARREQATTFYVRAEGAEDAKADADELVELGDVDWESDFDPEVDLAEVARPQPGYPVWSGGEDGRWERPDDAEVEA